MPAQGEKLTLGDVAQLTRDPRTAAAVRRLASEKAPTVASQLVMWNVSAGLDWDAISKLSAAWASPRDVALARRFVESLDSPTAEETGRIFVQVEGDSDLSSAFAKLAKGGGSLLGLKVETGALRQARRPRPGRDDRRVGVEATRPRSPRRPSDGKGQWVDAGKLTLPLAKKDGKLDVVAFTDAMADGLLGKVLEARLVKAKKAHA